MKPLRWKACCVMNFTITPEVEQMMLQLHQGYQNKGKHLVSSKRIPSCTRSESFIRK